MQHGIKADQMLHFDVAQVEPHPWQRVEDAEIAAVEQSAVQADNVVSLIAQHRAEYRADISQMSGEQDSHC